jgi:hypothetical protein
MTVSKPVYAGLLNNCTVSERWLEEEEYASIYTWWWTDGFRFDDERVRALAVCCDSEGSWRVWNYHRN